MRTHHLGIMCLDDYQPLLIANSLLDLEYLIYKILFVQVQQQLLKLYVTLRT